MGVIVITGKDMRSELSLSDEWETPNDLIHELTKRHGVFSQLDVCATHDNTKCRSWYDSDMNGLTSQWIQDVWCNPPHSKTGLFVKKAYEQWKKYNVNIMMIIPTNTMSSNFWHNYIEGFAEYHPIKGRIRFLYNGRPAKDVARNAYVCVIWRKK